MSSTTAVASGVSYHIVSDKHNPSSGYLPCQGILENVSSTASGRYDISQNSCESDFMQQCCSGAQTVSTNIDTALRGSLKSCIYSGVHRLSDYDTKDFNRSICFRESSAPSLDSVIRQRIQTLPKHLILTDDAHEVQSTMCSSNCQTPLCSNADLEGFCRLGSQYVPRQPLGLNNTGNTCYLNSVIQCLLATGPLMAYISQKHSIPGQCALLTGSSPLDLSKGRFCGLCGLHRLLKEHFGQTNNNNAGFRLSYGGTVQTVPSYFICNVRAVCPNLRPYQQEDAHEFLLGLLSRMEDSAVAGLGKLPKAQLETNVIRRIFGTIVRSEVTCHSCRKVSARDEPCFNLSVDVTCGRSLQQCLFNYIRNEELCGQNAYKCENCRQLRPAVRRSTIFQGSPVLIIQFNRFSRNQKLDMRVEFPSSLNLRPFMTENKGAPVLYRLYATVNHEGHSCRSGHYVAFTRRNGTWLSHNDSVVNTTNADHVLRQSPYLLFYEALEPTTCFPCSTGEKSQVKPDAPLHNTPVVTIPLSQIPLPPPTPVNSNSNSKKESVSSTTCKQTPSSTPRIVFNQAVINKLPQPVSVRVANSSSVSQSSSTSNNDGPLRNDPLPSTCSNTSSAIRKLLYGDTAQPGLWTERPTPALSQSPLEKSVLRSPPSTPKLPLLNGQEGSSLPVKRKRSVSPSDSLPCKRDSPSHYTERDRTCSVKRSDDNATRTGASTAIGRQSYQNESHRSASRASTTSDSSNFRVPANQFDRLRDNRSNSGRSAHTDHGDHRNKGVHSFRSASPNYHHTETRKHHRERHHHKKHKRHHKHLNSGSRHMPSRHGSYHKRSHKFHPGRM